MSIIFNRIFDNRNFHILILTNHSTGFGISLCFYTSVYPIYPSIIQSIHPSTYLPIYLSLYLSLPTWNKVGCQLQISLEPYTVESYNIVYYGQALLGRIAMTSVYPNFHSKWSKSNLLVSMTLSTYSTLVNKMHIEKFEISFLSGSIDVCRINFMLSSPSFAVAKTPENHWVSYFLLRNVLVEMYRSHFR